MSLKSFVPLCVPVLMAAQSAIAAPDFVADIALCPLSLMDCHEQGMSFDGQSPLTGNAQIVTRTAV